MDKVLFLRKNILFYKMFNLEYFFNPPTIIYSQNDYFANR